MHSLKSLKKVEKEECLSQSVSPTWSEVVSIESRHGQAVPLRGICMSCLKDVEHAEMDKQPMVVLSDCAHTGDSSYCVQLLTI